MNAQPRGTTARRQKTGTTPYTGTMVGRFSTDPISTAGRAACAREDAARKAHRGNV